MHRPEGFVPFPTIADANKVSKPRLTIVVACVDPRCSIDKFIDLNLGVPNGEMVMVSRNAGGNIRFAVRDILLLDTRFVIEELVVVHHTDCGSLMFTDDWMRTTVKARVGESYSEEIDQIDWGANTDMAGSVKDDLEWLRATQLIRAELRNKARGFLFDIKTGRAEEIKLA
ncbi:putative carbonic anhydrase protein [Phaeoacremonium minimum UCRPA7]|uniref:Putative carbonic anhydrase protein n=1 Tax=Phaeoacremonium minimum (strain UCR-PA7) TaxID=1286976 RepID=R8BN94_PHAM7|nr:putative carbonic anhydrase protein [Phaeoacremonium minimum UCRPA7]EOO00853.1 putative carbonic anhydrase protein [Phaeoacremonium minimum UCRPA7]